MFNRCRRALSCWCRIIYYLVIEIKIMEENFIFLVNLKTLNIITGVGLLLVYDLHLRSTEVSNTMGNTVTSLYIFKIPFELFSKSQCNIIPGPCWSLFLNAGTNSVQVRV